MYVYLHTGMMKLTKGVGTFTSTRDPITAGYFWTRRVLFTYPPDTRWVLLGIRRVLPPKGPKGTRRPKYQPGPKVPGGYVKSTLRVQKYPAVIGSRVGEKVSTPLLVFIIPVCRYTYTKPTFGMAALLVY
jgi:hypothetical protein